MPVRNVITMDKIDDKIVQCKAITSIKTYFGNATFTRRAAMFVLIKTVKLKRMTPGRSREYVAEALSPDQASRMFSNMINNGYLEFSHEHKLKPGQSPNPKLPVGEKMYKVGELRLAECMESNWYKNRIRKEKFVKKEEHIDTRSCAALQQIFSLFGTTPFTYKTVSMAASSISQLSEKSSEFNAAEIMSLKVMRRNLYGHDAGNFREVWQKLIRSGYIVHHKIKTSDGVIKSTGLFRINTPYLKHCLAGLL